MEGEKGEIVRFYLATATDSYYINPKDENKEWVEVKKGSIF
jgi:hypothetical protein